MDLTRLYNFTTPELRDEAERLGVRDTYAMSRGQLIQAIREHVEPPTTRKRGLFGKVVGFAKWAVQAAAETEAGTGSGAGPDTGIDDRDAEDRRTETESHDAGTDTATEHGHAIGAGTETGTGSETGTGTGTGPEAPPSRDPAPAGSSRPPAGVFANNGGLFEEPIPTRTMARILAEQGHFKRSLAIYARLLDEQPDDGELVSEVEAVREEAKARRSYAPQ